MSYWVVHVEGVVLHAVYVSPTVQSFPTFNPNPDVMNSISADVSRLELQSILLSWNLTGLTPLEPSLRTTSQYGVAGYLYQTAVALAGSSDPVSRPAELLLL